MTTTQLCSCVFAKGRRLYEKFHENLGVIPPDFDTLEDQEREAWTRTVAGKGNFIEVEDKPKKRTQRKLKTEPTTLSLDAPEPQSTDFKPPDWRQKEKEQKQELARQKREEVRLFKEATKAAAKATKSKPLI